MARAFIGIGSNVGDREGHLERARAGLAALPGTSLAKWSRVYETEPVGPVAQGNFLNCAAELLTALDPFELRRRLARIETEEGRDAAARKVKWGPRTLDLDILLFDDRVISTDELIVPHPMMHERLFVLRPLCDLDAKLVHPLLEMTVADLLKYAEEGQRP